MPKASLALITISVMVVCWRRLQRCNSPVAKVSSCHWTIKTYSVNYSVKSWARSFRSYQKTSLLLCNWQKNLTSAICSASSVKAVRKTALSFKRHCIWAMIPCALAEASYNKSGVRSAIKSPAAATTQRASSKSMT